MITNPVVRERLEKIKARFDAATPGPWENYAVGKGEAGGIAVINDGDAIVEDPNMTEEDTVFLAHVWADTKFLLEQIEGVHEQAKTQAELALGAVMTAKLALNGDSDPEEAMELIDSVIDELVDQDSAAEETSDEEDEDEDEDEDEEFDDEEDEDEDDDTEEDDEDDDA
jgi:hypothetical protein